MKNDRHCQGSLHIFNGENIIHNDQILGENKIKKMVYIRANLMGCQEGGHITSFLRSLKNMKVVALRCSFLNMELYKGLISAIASLSSV